MTVIDQVREGRSFKFRYAVRLAAALPPARVERIEDSYTFVSVDRPRRLAEFITAFAAEPVKPAVTGSVR